MSTVRITELISVEDYLEGELVSRAKHEYVAGAVFAMVGAKNSHNRIAGNAFGLLYSLLNGQPCQPCNADTKIRVRRPGHICFYYPDVSVVCEENPLSDTFDDPDHSIEEQRFIIIGHSENNRLLFVSHTDNGKIVRIISAREVTSAERKQYEEG